MRKAKLPRQSQGENLPGKKADSNWFIVISVADNKVDARTTQIDHYELRKQSYVSVTIYGAIRRKKELVNDRISSVYGHK